MDSTRVIVGTVVTEKAERLKMKKTHLLRIHPAATKVDVRNALRLHFGVDPLSVRVLRVRPKDRALGGGKTMRKRDATKRAYVTLAPKSKALDLTAFSS